MTDTTAHADGLVMLPRRLTFTAAIAVVAAIAGGGIGYAFMQADIATLKAARAEMAPKLEAINERTIRIETSVKFIEAAIVPPRRP